MIVNFLKVEIKVMQDSASSYYLILQEFVFACQESAGHWIWYRL